VAVVALSDAKAFLNITGTGSDNELVRMVDQAEAAIAARVGPLAPVTVTEMHHGGANPIVLRRPPVISVTSVVADGATTTSGFDLDSEAGLLFSESGYGYAGLPRSVQVTYTAGRSSLPADLEAAVLELVRHLWESQRGSTPVALAGAGDDGLRDTGSGFLLPYRVQSLLEPYLRPSVA
jgi:hypothetical protein